MFWFKNLMAYRLTKPLDLSSLEEALQQCRYSECSASDVSKFGWIAPLTTTEQLHFEASGQILLVSCKEEKILPANVVNKEFQNRIVALEAKEQRKLKKTEKMAIKDDVVAMLLPRAFSKYQYTALWVDTRKNIVYVDATSAKRAEDTLALLRKSLGSLPVVPLTYNHTPSEVMTDWLVNGTPQWLDLLEEGKLKRFDTDSIAIFKRQDLEGEEVTACLENGAQAVNLALCWENHLNFTMNEDGTLSRIKFEDDIRLANGHIPEESKAQRFDADFALMTGELSQLMERLADEFGGLRERD